MILQKLIMQNWKHFNTEKQVIFKPGINIIAGQNFVGKSSILEAIQYAICGKFPKGKPSSGKDWINKTSNHALLELFFSHENKYYVVKRSITPRKGKQDISDELFELIGDEETSICSGETVNEFIKAIIPWSSYTLNKILFLTDDVVKEISTGQKDIFKSLKDLLSFEETKDYLKQTINKLSSLEKEAKNIEKKLKDFKQSETDIDQEKKKFEERVKSQETLVKQAEKTLKHQTNRKKEIEVIKDKLSDINSLKSELKNLLEKVKVINISEVEIKVKEFENTISSKRKKLEDLTGSIGENRGKISVSKDILKVLENTTDQKCPVCKKNLSDAERTSLQNEYTENIRLYKEKIAQLEEQSSQCTKTIHDITTQINIFKQTKNNYEQKVIILNERMKGVDFNVDYSKEYERIKEKVKHSKDYLQQVRKELNHLNGELSRVIKEIEFLKEDLPRKLRKTWTKWHQSNITKEALEQTENEFILRQLKTIENEIIQNWKTFQSTPISVSLGTHKGIEVKLYREEKEFEIVELSGSEKRIFILLIALLLNQKFYNYPFQTIDEPFEPLDLENIEKLETFLASLADNHQIIATAVGNFVSKRSNIIEL